MQTRARARSWGAVVAWSGGGEHHALASVPQTPARRTPERTPSTCSALQLPLQLIEEPPVGSLRDDPIRVGLDHSRLPQAQGVEAHGVLRVVVPPLCVANLVHCLQRIVVAVAF